MLLKANDEWQLQHRYMQTEAMAELKPPTIDAVLYRDRHHSRLTNGHLNHTAFHTSLTDVIDGFGISRHHLIRVAQRLRDCGYVDTKHFNGRGVRRAKRPEAINIGAVIRCTETYFALVACFAPDGVCRVMPGCILRSVLAEAMEAFSERSTATTWPMC